MSVGSIDGIHHFREFSRSDETLGHEEAGGRGHVEPELMIFAGDALEGAFEVLVHAFDARDGKVTADLEWTFPLRQAELAWWDGAAVRRRTIALDDTREEGRRTFAWPLDLQGVRWVRLEAWDVATNGAFTQPLWIAP